MNIQDAIQHLLGTIKQGDLWWMDHPATCCYCVQVKRIRANYTPYFRPKYYVQFLLAMNTTILSPPSLPRQPPLHLSLSLFAQWIQWHHDKHSGERSRRVVPTLTQTNPVITSNWCCQKSFQSRKALGDILPKRLAEGCQLLYTRTELGRWRRRREDRGRREEAEAEEKQEVCL